QYRPAFGEKTSRARTARTCKALLKLERALWTFARREGVEPTNNAAERAIRPAVIWRKTSYGTESEKGSEYVARMMTVIMTLKMQGRNVFEYMIEACMRARRGEHPPSLLPAMSFST
ncbi:MAG: IS66 family transposase, partial [Deltaproteobacteria bacterium]